MSISGPDTDAATARVFRRQAAEALAKADAAPALRDHYVCQAALWHRVAQLLDAYGRRGEGRAAG